MTAALAIVSAAAWAQQQPAAPRATPRQQPGTVQAQPGLQQQGTVQQQRVTANKPVAGEGQSADQTIANCIAIDNQEEIALAKFAASKSENRKVRELAETLVKDHTKFLQQLERYGVMVGIHNAQNQRGDAAEQVLRTAQTARAQPRQEQAERQQQALTSQQEGGRPPLNFLSIKRQIAERCVMSAEKELGQKRPEHMDKAFVGMQIGAHARMLEELKVLRQYASADLQGVIDEGVQTTESHLDQAKQLMLSLENAN